MCEAHPSVGGARRAWSGRLVTHASASRAVHPLTAPGTRGCHPHAMRTASRPARASRAAVIGQPLDHGRIEVETSRGVGVSASVQAARPWRWRGSSNSLAITSRAARLGAQGHGHAGRRPHRTRQPHPLSAWPAPPAGSPSPPPDDAGGARDPQVPVEARIPPSLRGGSTVSRRGPEPGGPPARPRCRCLEG